MMNEQAQGNFVHPLALGEGQSLANKASETLTQRVVPTLNAASLARAFASAAAGAPWEHFVVGQPEVAAGGAAAVRGRVALTQSAGTVGRSVAHEVRPGLAGLPTQSNPDPAGVELAAHEAPEFSELEHAARLGGQKRLAQRRETFDFFSSHLEIVPRATPKTRWAARRLRRSVATARSTSALRSGAVSRLLGASTRLTPHARQRNCWRPQTFSPFLTMRSLPQAVQHGTARVRDDVRPIAQHRR